MRLNFAGRQWALQLFERMDYVEFNAIADDTYGLITVPPGSYVQTAIAAVVDTSFVGPTDAELVVTNDATGGAIATVDLTAAPGSTSLLAAGYYADGFRIRVAVNKSGAVATAGVVRLVGAYVIDKRANETQTDVRPLT